MTVKFTVKQPLFNQIADGNIKEYNADIVYGNDYLDILESDNNGELIYNNSLIDKDNELLGEPLIYNHGKFPYYAIPYRYMEMVSGNGKNADHALLEIKDISFIIIKNKKGEDAIFDTDENGKVFINQNGKYAYWNAVYHLGDIISINRGIKTEEKIIPSIDADGTMRGISVKQPWATLLCTIKDVENRSWSTNIRGKILIHASAKPESEDPWSLFSIAEEKAVKDAMDKGIISDPRDFPTGCIVGYATLINCAENDPSIWADRNSFNWKFKEPHLFKHPIEGIKGKLGFLKYKGELPETFS